MAPSDIKPVEQLKTPVGRMKREFGMKPIAGGYMLNTGYRVMRDDDGKRFALLDLDGNEVVHGVTVYRALQRMQAIRDEIVNIVQVTPRLWVGGDPLYSTSYPSILMEPDLIVIDARSDYERFAGWDEVLATYNPQATLIHAPMYDEAGSTGNTRDFMLLHDRLYRLQGKRRARPIFVHCHMGINRSPSIVFFLMLMGYFHGSPRVAYKRLRAVRPEAGIKYSAEALEAGMSLIQAGGMGQDGVRYRQGQLEEWDAFLADYWTDQKWDHIRHEIRKRRNWADDKVINASQFDQYLEVSNGS